MSGSHGLKERILGPIFLGLFIGFILFTAIPTAHDNDVWFHVLNGGKIWRDGLSKQDYLSYTIPPERQWIMQEWLTQVIFFKFAETFGFEDLTIAKGVLITFTLAFWFWLSLRLGAHPVLVFFLSLWGYLLISGMLQIRPQIMTFFCFMVLLFILQEDRKGQPMAKWLLVPLFWIWANLHGAFIMGIGVLGMQAVGSMIGGWFFGETGEHSRGLRLLPFCLAGFLVPLCTPNGISIYTYLWDYAGESYMFEFTSEWQSPNFHIWGIFKWYLLLFWMSFATSPHRGRFTDLFTAVVLTSQALFATRHISFQVFFTVPVLVEHLSNWIQKPGSASPSPSDVIPSESSSAFLKRCGFLFIGLFACWATVFGIIRQPGVRNIFNAKIDESIFPRKAVEIMANRPFSPNLFNEYDWGHYLNYRLYPKIKVFLDGRCDIFGQQIIEDFNKARAIDPGEYHKIFTKYSIQTALVSNLNPLYYHLASDPEWICISDDEKARLFEKRNPKPQ